MIERVVLIKLKQEFAAPDGRREVASYTREALSGVPGARQVSVGLPADERSEEDWDLCINVRFDSLADVEPYRDHPRHRAYVDEYLRPKLEVLKAWNFTPA